MSSKLDNFTETSDPIVKREFYSYIIPMGAEVTHKFDVTLYLDENKTLDNYYYSVIYRQGVDIVDVFVPNPVTEDTEKQIISIRLAPSETSKFAYDLLDCFAQVRLEDKNTGEVIYSLPYICKVIPMLDSVTK